MSQPLFLAKKPRKWRQAGMRGKKKIKRNRIRLKLSKHEWLRLQRHGLKNENDAEFYKQKIHVLEQELIKERIEKECLLREIEEVKKKLRRSPMNWSVELE